MSKKKKKRFKRKRRSDGKLYITRKIEFIPDKSAEIMLIKNCEYRHFLYNKCVEIVKSCEENHPDGYIGVNEYVLLQTIRDDYESNILNDKRPEYLEDYDYYFRGISECTVDDIQSTCHRIIFERSNCNSSDIQFVKYNPNKLSFRFKNKIDIRKPKDSKGFYQTNRLVLTENPYIIGLKINQDMGVLGLQLKESIDKFNINLNNIKEISIKFHNEKWYLCLIIDYTEEYSKINMIYSKSKRKKIAGIDLGETNPVVMYDGKFVRIPNHLQYPKDKITKVENRIQRLQRVMDQKYNPDMDKFHQSNNYYKVLKKFHKAWEHLVNIKKDWYFKLAHWIVTHYKNVVVDEFYDYIRKVTSNYPENMRKNINRGMQNKGMYNFNRRLIHMCHKYGTNYYIPLMETTNTCSVCGNVNEVKLRIDENHNERIFKCERCDHAMDRDDNASINCYNAFYDNMIMIPE